MWKGKANTLAYKVYKNLKKCENCGATEKLVRHHEDYDEPLKIKVLCVKCHRRWHAKNKAINGQGYSHIFIRLSDKAKTEFLTAIEIMNYNNGTRYNQQDMGEMLITKWAKKFLRNQNSLVNDNREIVDTGFITEIKDLSPESKKIIKKALK